MLSVIADDRTASSFTVDIELLFVVFRLEKKPCSLDEVVDDADSAATLLSLLLLSKALPSASFNLETSDCKASTTLRYSPFFFISATWCDSVEIDECDGFIISIDFARLA